VLVGNRAEAGGHGMWPAFAASSEYGDGLPDPLNRWTQRIVRPIAEAANSVALYPFGETVWPFQRYAAAATGMRASPLGILIHPEYGLWHAFRAVLVMSGPVRLAARAQAVYPCDGCAAMPWLSACPVSAVGIGGFDVGACRGHLASGNEPDCMALGCLARAACPVGVAYPPDQIRFHMAQIGVGQG